MTQLNGLIINLIRVQVCVRCIFRLFGIRGDVYSCQDLSPSVIYSLLEIATVADESIQREVSDGFRGTELDIGLCCICLGVLQFYHRDGSGKEVKNQSPIDVASIIGEIVKKEGHIVGDFSLEISVPPIILENEHAARLVCLQNFGKMCVTIEASACFRMDDFRIILFGT